MPRNRSIGNNWHLLDREQLEQHLKALKSVGLKPTSDFRRVLRAKRQAADQRGIARRTS